MKLESVTGSSDKYFSVSLGVPLLRIERAKGNASSRHCLLVLAPHSRPVIPFVFSFELLLSNKIQQNTAQDIWHFLKVKNDAFVCEIAVTTLISVTKPGKCASFSKKPCYGDFVVNKGKRHAQEIFRETALHKSQKKRRKTYELHSASPITYLGHNQAGICNVFGSFKIYPQNRLSQVWPFCLCKIFKCGRGCNFWKFC